MYVKKIELKYQSPEKGLEHGKIISNENMKSMKEQPKDLEGLTKFLG